MREQEAPQVGRISHAIWNSGQEREQSCLKGPLQEDRPPEPPGSQVSGKTQHSLYSLVAALAVVLDDLVDMGVVGENRYDPGLCQNRDVRLGKRSADASKGSRRKDHVADPVLGPNEDLPWAHCKGPSTHKFHFPPSGRRPLGEMIARHAGSDVKVEPGEGEGAVMQRAFFS